MAMFPLTRRQPAARFALCLAAFSPVPLAAAPIKPVAPQPARAATGVGTGAAKTYPAPVIHQATVYVTARDTDDRMRAGETLRLEELAQPEESMSLVMLDPTRRFQTILGFGGAFTDAAAETFAKLPPAKQAEVLTAYFSPDKGLGYTLGRTNINSCDFSSDT